MSDLTVKELKRKAVQVRHDMDELNRAAYGMTFDELIKLALPKCKEENLRESEDCEDAENRI